METALSAVPRGIGVEKGDREQDLRLLEELMR